MHTAAPCLHLRLHFRTRLAAHTHLTRELRGLLRPVTTMTETSSCSSSVCSTRSLVRMPAEAAAWFVHTHTLFRTPADA